MQLDNVMSLERESIKASSGPMNNRAQGCFHFAPVTTHMMVGYCQWLHMPVKERGPRPSTCHLT